MPLRPACSTNFSVAASQQHGRLISLNASAATASLSSAVARSSTRAASRHGQRLQGARHVKKRCPQRVQTAWKTLFSWRSVHGRPCVKGSQWQCIESAKSRTGARRFGTPATWSNRRARRQLASDLRAGGAHRALWTAGTPFPCCSSRLCCTRRRRRASRWSSPRTGSSKTCPCARSPPADMCPPRRPPRISSNVRGRPRGILFLPFSVTAAFRLLL